MTSRQSFDVERRQCARLVRMSFGRLMDAAVASREVAAEYFVLWSAALLLTPPLFYTIQRTSAYPWIRFRSIEALQRVALTDRLFFVVWSMLAAMLVVSVLWDALFPDRRDQQILGVLPVRSRTVAAARLTAALAAGVALALAIGLPTAVAYGISGAAHASIGSISAVFAGHLVATCLAGLFTFCALLFVRGTLVFVLGAAVARQAAVLLQLVTVLLLVQAFMFLPGIVPGIVGALLDGTPDLSVWPPVWFIAAYARMAGPHADTVGATAGWAYWATAAALVLAAAAYLLPARVNARRALESRESERAGTLLPLAARWASLILLRRAPTRALFRFTLFSFLRNRQPLFAAAGFLGLGLALSGVRLTSAMVRARPRSVDPTALRIGAPLALGGLHVFAFRLDDVQRLALVVEGGVGWYVVACLIAVAALRTWDAYRARPRDVSFELEEDAVIAQLSLGR